MGKRKFGFSPPDYQTAAVTSPPLIPPSQVSANATRQAYTVAELTPLVGSYDKCVVIVSDLSGANAEWDEGDQTAANGTTIIGSTLAGRWRVLGTPGGGVGGTPLSSITLPAVTGTVADSSLAFASSIVFSASGGVRTLRGVTANTTPGGMHPSKTFYNADVYDQIWTHQDSGATAKDRVVLTDGSSFTQRPNTTTVFDYDYSAQRWRMRSNPLTFGWQASELTASPGRVDAEARSCNGYNTVNDGGGGNFQWYASATDAIDSGIFFGSGGIGRWKRVLESGYVNANWWGVLTTNTASANDDALKRMRNSLVAIDPSAHWRIVFGKTGIYQYSYNKWLCGFLDYTIDLNGSTLKYYQPAGTATTSDTNTMLVWPDPWHVFNDGNDWNVVGQSWHHGYKIASVDAGSQTVTVLNATQAGYLAAGDPILIGGWDPSWLSYPPPFEAFEFNTIKSIAGTVVTLTERTRNVYSADWPDHTVAGGSVASADAGAVRIYLLRNRSRDPALAGYAWRDMPRRGEFKNGTIMGTAAAAADGMPFYLAGYESTSFSNLRIDATQWAVNSEIVKFEDCTWFGEQINSSVGHRGFDIDKCISAISFNRCKATWISGATSVRSLSIQNSVVELGIATQAKKQLFENVVVNQRTTAIAPIMSQFNTRCRNVQASNSDTTGGGWLEPFDYTGSTFTLATVGADSSLVTFNEQVFPDIPRMKPGDRLMKTDASYYGVVVDAIHPRTFKVRWSATPTVGHVFYLMDDYVFDVDDSCGNRAGWVGCITRARGGSVTLKSPALNSYSTQAFYTPTKITSVTVNVTKVGAVHGFIMIRGHGGVGNLVRIATDSLGTRTCTSAGVTGITGNDYRPFGSGVDWFDVSSWTLLANYYPRVRIDYSSGGSGPSEWPVFTMTINCQELAF